MSDTNNKPITENPYFVKYDDFLNDHTKEAKDMGITDKGTLTFYYNGTMDGMLYDIGSHNGHSGMSMYWEIFNTIRCITLPREIKMVGIDKVKELRTAELDKLDKKIRAKYKELDNTRGEGLGLPVGVGVITAEESMEWLIGIIALRTLGRESDNNFGESITWGISPDDFNKFGGKINQPETAQEEGSTADVDDLVDWIDGKTSNKPKNKEEVEEEEEEEDEEVVDAICEVCQIGATITQKYQEEWKDVEGEVWGQMSHDNGNQFYLCPSCLRKEWDEGEDGRRCSECNKEWEEYLTPSEQLGGCMSYGMCEDCERVKGLRKDK